MKTMKPCVFLILSSLLLPGLAKADALTDLRANLPKLTSDQPVSARVQITTRRSGGESDKQQKADGVSTVLVRLDPSGFALTWTPEQIRQTRHAAAEKVANPDAAKSSLATLAALDADEALNLLDAADPLRLSLDKATLLEDKPVIYRSQPAHRLFIQLDLKLPEEGRKAAKSVSANLTLWVNAGGMPLAADRDIRIRFSKFFLSYTVREHTVREYQMTNGHLVVIHTVQESYGSGLGHVEENHSSITVKPLPD